LKRQSSRAVSSSWVSMIWSLSPLAWPSFMVDLVWFYFLSR
jgi:hypothetical protein